MLCAPWHTCMRTPSCCPTLASAELTPLLLNATPQLLVLVSVFLLVEGPEEASGAVDHAGSLGLLNLGAGHGQGVVHVALLVQNGLQTHNTTNIQRRNRWIHEILYCIKLERLRFSLNSSLDSFNKTWQPLLDHISSLTITNDSNN